MQHQYGQHWGLPRNHGNHTTLSRLVWLWDASAEPCHIQKNRIRIPLELKLDVAKHIILFFWGQSREQQECLKALRLLEALLAEIAKTIVSSSSFFWNISVLLIGLCVWCWSGSENKIEPCTRPPTTGLSRHSQSKLKSICKRDSPS